MAKSNRSVPSTSDHDSDSGSKKVLNALCNTKTVRDELVDNVIIDTGLKRIIRLWSISCPPYTDDNVWDKTDVADIFHWLKQVLAISFGICCGIVGITGWLGYASILSLLCLASNAYLKLAKIPDDIMSTGEALQESLMPAIMTFTLFWTLANTFIRGSNFG